MADSLIVGIKDKTKGGVMELRDQVNTEEYIYDIEGNRTVRIIFIDGMFHEAKYPFKDCYTREQWKILAAIEAEISRIEKEKAA